MRTVLRVIWTFVLGFVPTYAGVVTGVLAYASLNHIVDRDGGMTMAVMFAVGPLAGILGGVACAIAVPIWLARRDRDRTEGRRPPAKPWPRPMRIAVAAIGCGVPVYLLGLFVFWLLSPMSFRSYWIALAVGNAPLAVALAAAVLAASMAARKGQHTA